MQAAGKHTKAGCLCQRSRSVGIWTDVLKCPLACYRGMGWIGLIPPVHVYLLSEFIINIQFIHVYAEIVMFIVLNYITVRWGDSVLNGISSSSGTTGYTCYGTT